MSAYKHASALLCMSLTRAYGRALTGGIGSRKEVAGGRLPGCSGGVFGVPSGLVGTIYTQPNSEFMETSALLTTKKASFGIKTYHLAIPLIKGQKIVDLEKMIFGPKVFLGVRKRCF